MESENHKDHKYSRVREKVRNPRVGNEVAWVEAQPMFSHDINGFTDRPYSEVIRRLFDLRRDAFRNIDKDKANKEAKKLLSGLTDDDFEKLQDVVVYIRDLFDIPAPNRRG